MKGFVVLDMASIIWDIAHYENNRHTYYKLMEVLPTLFTSIMANDIPIVFRNELIDEVHSYFPYEHIPGEYYDYQVSTLHFLTQATFEVYPTLDDTGVNCTPDLVKSFFSTGTRTEVRYIISYIYTQKRARKGVLSFKHLWATPYSLTLDGPDPVKVKVDLCDNPDLHNKILLKFKKSFEHNPKHNKYKSSRHAFHGEVISKLSCYNNRTGDITAAQALLDKSLVYKSHYYAYDLSNETYVKFVKTGGNKYHGYDVIPAEPDLISLRSIFNK